MTLKKLAVAVVHGIGTYPALAPELSEQLTFSSQLKQRVARSLRRSGAYPTRQHFDTDIAWREVRYGHIFEDTQFGLLKALKGLVKMDLPRDIIVRNIGDAAAYRPMRYPDKDDPQIYDRVHQCLAESLARLEAEIEPDAPLIILAHSLGGHVASNYLWDCRREGATLMGRPLSDFQRGKRLCTLITFGCNIPLFLFGKAPQGIQVMPYPGDQCSQAVRETAWWLNYFDRDDPLGYPLGVCGGDYETMLEAGRLRDLPVNVGAWWQRWNFLSHNGYWRDRAFYRPVAARIERALARLQQAQ